jgi:hypothetical protein|tara:strand:+ start:43 stop:381 length:339 start_codon:yes stop_codon:yes gene_type:complete
MKITVQRLKQLIKEEVLALEQEEVEQKKDFLKQLPSDVQTSLRHIESYIDQNSELEPFLKGLGIVLKNKVRNNQVSDDEMREALAIFTSDITRDSVKITPDSVKMDGDEDGL